MNKEKKFRFFADTRVGWWLVCFVIGPLLERLGIIDESILPERFREKNK